MADTETTTDTTTTADQTVPYSRFQQVVTSKNELTAQVASLQAEVQTLTEKAATVDTLSSQLQAAETKAETAESKYVRWQAIASAIGTTDAEAIEAAEWAHGRLPEEDRPEIGTWLTGIQEAPETAPKVLQPWLTTTDTTTTTTTNTKVTPRSPARGSQQPGAPSSVSAEAIRAAKDHGVKTGDWSRYKELSVAAGYRKSAS